YEVVLEISEGEALGMDWGSPQVVLMNPPFVQVENLDVEQKQAAMHVLQASATGRFDLSMAFISKASASVADGGVLTSLLPASLLETKSGEVWRASLAENNRIKLLGRFQGFNLFRNSTVEIGLVTLHRATEVESDSTMLLVAEASREGAALKAIRLLQESNSDGFELFSVPPTEVDAASWLPRSLWSLGLKKELALRDLPKISELFDVRQGIRTGANSIFVLTKSQIEQLPEVERVWFRPTVGQGSISGGAIRVYEYVFYPHSFNGLELRSEEDLLIALPNYFENVLAPNASLLKGRHGRTAENWWKLSEHRQWLGESRPKLVSTYFGGSGSFAFDADGHLAVVQGFGWLKKPTATVVALTEDGETVTWECTRTPYAFLAVLNSEFFQQVLGLHCPRVQGGQYDLSPRYIDNVPIPDPDDDRQVPFDIAESLADIGEALARRESINREKLEVLVKSAYGLR
ncbi:MAG TPA: hypothetical protein VK171_11600, partial [Fimbriimonas sp.]|nr:hypothetical protein [Fimbriimonas sp.]